jgi:DNA-binding CsgD family transcriptional regulator
MSCDDARRGVDDDRLLTTLQRLLGIRATSLRPAMDEAADLINAALNVEKVDVFTYEASTESLIAFGVSNTPMGRRQEEIGMHRQPLINGGRSASVYQTGAAYITGRADDDPVELRGIVEGLGVLSEIICPVDVAGERRGVLAAVSPQPDFFTERDLRFLQAVSGWVGIVMHRAELFQQVAHEGVLQGRRQFADELARVTPRERDVAISIAAGLTNAEIAARMVIVPGTVANYVERILRKLGLRSRTQIAVWAVEHGLYRSNGDNDDQAEPPALQ